MAELVSLAERPGKPRLSLIISNASIVQARGAMTSAL
jgi:hypothetical protein